jgi:5-methylcytosine-specific restriction endonuclease McrA
VSIHRACLVLNASYEPVSISSARRAITLLVKGAAHIEEHYGREVYPGIWLPSVIRLRNYRHIPMRITCLTRKNIYARDHNMCQYCGHKFNPKFLTLDHIIPESKGGPFSWHNLVACCVKCNRRKADKSLEESGMTLLHKPRPMTLHTSRFLIRLIGLEEDRNWHKYLYTESDEVFT